MAFHERNQGEKGLELFPFQFTRKPEKCTDVSRSTELNVFYVPLFNKSNGNPKDEYFWSRKNCKALSFRFYKESEALFENCPDAVACYQVQLLLQSKLDKFCLKHAVSPQQVTACIEKNGDITTNPFFMDEAKSPQNNCRMG